MIIKKWKKTEREKKKTVGCDLAFGSGEAEVMESTVQSFSIRDTAVRGRKLLLGMLGFSFSQGQMKHRPSCLVTATTAHSQLKRWDLDTGAIVKQGGERHPRNRCRRKRKQNDDGLEGGLSPHSTGGRYQVKDWLFVF